MRIKLERNGLGRGIDGYNKRLGYFIDKVKSEIFISILFSPIDIDTFSFSNYAIDMEAGVLAA